MHPTTSEIQISQPCTFLMIMAVTASVVMGAVKWIALGNFDNMEAKSFTVTWIIIIVMTVEFFGSLLLTGISSHYVAYHYKELSREWLIMFGMLFLCWSANYKLFIAMILKIRMPSQKKRIR